MLLQEGHIKLHSGKSGLPSLVSATSSTRCSLLINLPRRNKKHSSATCVCCDIRRSHYGNWQFTAAVLQGARSCGVAVICALVKVPGVSLLLVFWREDYSQVLVGIQFLEAVKPCSDRQQAFC